MKSNFFTKFKCVVVGWDYSILRECGESSYRTLNTYIACLTILAMIWGCVGFCFAGRYLGFEHIFPKIVVVAFAIVLITCIERIIILHTGDLGWLGVFRVLLAVLMAMIGATILDQIIFGNDVDVKMEEIRTEQIYSESEKRCRALDKEIDLLSRQIDTLGEECTRLYEEIGKRPVFAYQDVVSERRPTGAVDSLGNAIYETVRRVETKHASNPNSLKLQGVEKEKEAKMKNLDNMKAQRLDMENTVRKEYEKKAPSFLEELQALFGIVFSNLVAGVFYIIVFLFLLFLELLVVTNKMGAEPCDYELIVKHQLEVKEGTLAKTSGILGGHREEGMIR
nr:MAG TPA: protein of unknown function (DUF4407) [Caudoviricetes sp.]